MNESLHDLFIEKLQDLYDAENLITSALPKMIKTASDEELKAGFELHLEQTRGHISRLEEIASSLNFKLEGKKSKIMETIIAEGEKRLAKKANWDTEVLDAALIAAAQKVEHYEIACYGTAASWAKTMEHSEEADLLGQTLQEEKETDQKLSAIAEGGIFTTGINEEATAGADDM